MGGAAGTVAVGAAEGRPGAAVSVAVGVVARRGETATGAAREPAAGVLTRCAGRLAARVGVAREAPRLGDAGTAPFAPPPSPHALINSAENTRDRSRCDLKVACLSRCPVRGDLPREVSIRLYEDYTSSVRQLVPGQGHNRVTDRRATHCWSYDEHPLGCRAG